MHISTSDWIGLIGLIVGGPIGGLLISLIQAKVKLPPAAQSALSKVGLDSITKIIVEATTLQGMTDLQRNAWATKELQDVARRKLGGPLPDSIANILVEFVFSKLRAKKRV
jgi:hypothetical protein